MTQWEKQEDGKFHPMGERNRYILVGGNPLRQFRGGMNYTGLSVVGSANTVEEAQKVTQEQYDLCGGLILWIDTETGQPGEPGNDATLKF